MKKPASLLLLFVLANMWAAAQEQYHFTVDYSSKQDTIVVYDAHDNVVLLFGKDVFVYRQAPVTVAKDKRSLVFSSAGKEYSCSYSGNKNGRSAVLDNIVLI